MTKLATVGDKSKSRAFLSKFTGALSTKLGHIYHALLLLMGRETQGKYLNRIYKIDL